MINGGGERERERKGKGTNFSGLHHQGLLFRKSSQEFQKYEFLTYFPCIQMKKWPQATL